MPLSVTNRLFTGYRWDDTIGLYDANARFYDPYLGQFTQPDSLIPQPYNPIALNRYAYVYNSPMNYVDPSGHFPWAALIPWAIAGSAGGTLNVTVGYVTTDNYDFTQGTTDFAIGFGFGLAAYGTGGITPAAVGRFGLRGVAAEVAAPGARLAVLGGLNVAETGLASQVRGQEFGLAEAQAAFGWGVFGGGVGETIGVVGKWRANKVHLNYSTQKKAVRTLRLSQGTRIRNYESFARARIKPHRITLASGRFGYPQKVVNRVIGQRAELIGQANKIIPPPLQYPAKLNRIIRTGTFLGATAFGDAEYHPIIFDFLP